MQAAYDYLKSFGIQYILVALDELETVAETSTYGLENSEIKHMDGRAIKLLGKAIKEEDPRRKLPWLRYVALCSPAIGDELREIQSTARRFELVELSQNAFADVSDFVKTLSQEKRLSENYAPGLVEAAYTMSGGNFGWFNVIMANIDGRLRVRRSEGAHNSTDESVPVAKLFDELVSSTSRVRDYILDHNAITELQIDRTYLPAAKALLYGQLPRPLSHWQAEEFKALLAAQNEYNEPISLQYRQVEWDELDCSKALRAAKFVREKDEWRLASVAQTLDLRQLLDNLSTYAIYAHQSEDSPAQFNRTPDGKRILLVPMSQPSFLDLVSFLYPHPAADDAARALWQHFFGDDTLETKPTHLGPSIAMLERLDLRYRKRSQTSLIFRNSDQSSAHEQAMSDRKQQSAVERSLEILTGIMRVLDQNWGYDPVSANLPSDLIAIATPRASRGRDQGGLLNCNALKLHPKGRAILAWVTNEKELESLCMAVSSQFANEGKTPVLAFTSSRALIERFKNPASTKLRDAKEYLMVYQLSTNEEYVLHRIGIHSQKQAGFQLALSNFNMAFTQRINAFQRGLLEEIERWRKELNQKGLIAWPLRPSGSLKAEEKAVLRNTWKYLLKEASAPDLYQIDEKSGVEIESVKAIIEKLSLPRSIKSAGYGDDERANLFSGTGGNATAEIPPFLVKTLERLVKAKSSWSLSVANQNWFWGYTWEGAKPRDVFHDWLNLAVDLGFASAGASGTYEFLQSQTLRGRIKAAENWLNDDYPSTVLKMQEVFGEGEINQLFGSIHNTGTKTALARDKIGDAKDCLKTLEAKENSCFESVDFSQRKEQLLVLAKKRLELIDAVSFVFDQKKYESFQEDNVKTLNFRNEEEPLWRRLRRAELFSDRVLAIRDSIKQKIGTLRSVMGAESNGLNHFPLPLFTLSLEKISNILDGAIQVSSPLGNTAQQQMTDASALGQCLRDLRVGDAMNRLAQLSKEVGLDIAGTAPVEIAFDQIDGQIISGFRRFKQAFENVQEQLNDSETRLSKLEKILKDAPSTFQYPPTIDSFMQLKQRPSFIADSLADIKDDEIENLREDPLYDKPAKQGNFQPIMKAADSLLQTPRQQLQQLRAQLITLDNSVSGFLDELLNQSDIQSIEHSLNRLLQAQGHPQKAQLSRSELEKAGSLKQAAAKLEERCTDWVEKGEKLLPESISFVRWQRIVEQIEKGKDPNLTSDEEDKLLRASFLVRSYRLGGQ